MEEREGAGVSHSYVIGAAALISIFVFKTTKRALPPQHRSAGLQPPPPPPNVWKVESHVSDAGSHFPLITYIGKRGEKKHASV